MCKIPSVVHLCIFCEKCVRSRRGLDFSKFDKGIFPARVKKFFPELQQLSKTYEILTKWKTTRTPRGRRAKRTAPLGRRRRRRLVVFHLVRISYVFDNFRSSGNHFFTRAGKKSLSNLLKSSPRLEQTHFSQKIHRRTTRSNKNPPNLPMLKK